jgi:hypothetical protein
MVTVTAELSEKQVENIRLFMQERGIKHFTHGVTEYIAYIEQKAKQNVNADMLLASALPAGTNPTVDAVIARAIGTEPPGPPSFASHPGRRVG